MTVIKCGGKSLPQLNQSFAQFIRAWQQQDSLVIVHGGGTAIEELERALHWESYFNYDGQRITNTQTMKAVVYSLCGLVNSQLVALLGANSVAAFGLSGLDGGLLRARLKNYRTLGWVGEIVEVRAEILQSLCQQGFVPVVAPVSLQVQPKDAPSAQPISPGHWLNVNADDAASAIARALSAQSMVFISDIPGILDAHNKPLSQVCEAQIRGMIASGTIHGGMTPKVESALAALKDKRSDLKRVYIIDGTASCLLRQDNGGDIHDRLQGTCILL